MKGLLARFADLNRATNKLYYRAASRPHYWEVYRTMLDDAIRPARDIIHLGCGPLDLAEVTRVPLAGKTVYAVDPDEEAVSRNPAQHRIVAMGESIPLPDGMCDVIAAEHLVEHLADPGAVLREAHRLLRPGGRFVFTCPNLLSYSGVATHVTPYWFHREFLALLNRSRAQVEKASYPTYFRMNTVWAVRREAARAGFKVHDLFTGVDHPTYTAVLPGVHQAAAAWHLLLDRVPQLAPFRMTLTGSLERI